MLATPVENHTAAAHHVRPQHPQVFFNAADLEPPRWKSSLSLPNRSTPEQTPYNLHRSPRRSASFSKPPSDSSCLSSTKPTLFCGVSTPDSVYGDLQRWDGVWQNRSERREAAGTLFQNIDAATMSAEDLFGAFAFVPISLRIASRTTACPHGALRRRHHRRQILPHSHQCGYGTGEYAPKVPFSTATTRNPATPHLEWIFEGFEDLRLGQRHLPRVRPQEKPVQREKLPASTSRSSSPTATFSAPRPCPCEKHSKSPSNNALRRRPRWASSRSRGTRRPSISKTVLWIQQSHRLSEAASSLCCLRTSLPTSRKNSPT